MPGVLLKTWWACLLCLKSDNKDFSLEVKDKDGFLNQFEEFWEILYSGFSP